MRQVVRIRMLPVPELRVSKLNPRRGPGDVDELAASIRNLGLLQPLLVTPDGDGRYLVLAGSRRLAAARQVRLQEVPCIVRRLGERDREVAMLMENVHRVPLTPVEEAAVYARLMKIHGLAQHEVGEACGVSQTKVSHYLALLHLPKALLEQVDRGDVSVSEALGLGEYRDYKTKPKQPQGQKSACSLEKHAPHDGRRCQVRKLMLAEVSA